MGSGIGGNYSGTSGSSQPYANTYKVVSSQLRKDKKDRDIYSGNSGYFKNPTAVYLESSVSENRIEIEGHRAEGKMTYVMDKTGNIIFGKRSNPNNAQKRAPHPTLIGGKNPEVQCAGMIDFRKGKIYSVDISSGHYKPNIKSLEKVDKALQQLCNKNPNLFSRDSKWRKKK
ncbi:MAG: hypothetical protein I3I98_04920 [Mobilibacterium timonense]|uniref:hypothetical protein n=1 Tax=Mobilibacterium timonense TaxID=1871012 RepID=UPI0023564F46|nr:hypothetical protein [Mobilibacterium timonense]MBM6990734.1 hypothetical protein [Mobilibacterium timonense]